jgi:Tfp pilus assembly protein PilF
MKRIFLSFVLLGMLTTVVHASRVAPFSELMERGDAAYGRFDNKTAMASFKEALEADPSSYEAAWKLARALIDVGEKLNSKEERRKLYLEANQAARKATEINPSGSKGRLYMAISLGRVALDEGGKEKVRLSKEIKEELDKALQLDPSDDIAWHVLALWNRNVATLSWIERKFADMFLGGVPKEASMEKAVECLQKALALKGSHINHHLELGITYDMLGRRDDALKEYRIVLELPITDSDDEDHKAYAEKGLKEVLKPR